MGDLDLGLMWGYWGQLPPPNLVELTQEAERLGFASVWTSESWGSDAFSPLAYLAAVTEKIQLGTAVAQLAARTPTATAMHALTIDHLSNGRFNLGLGVSGPRSSRAGTASRRTSRSPAPGSTSRSSGE